MNNFSVIKKIKRTILIVEDEYINVEILKEIIGDTYEILTASNGQEALEVIKKSLVPISLVMSDINMPIMNGLELLKILKSNEEYKRIPVIVLTSDRTLELKALQLGAVDYIKKPYDLPEIVEARVRRAIELSEDRILIQAAHGLKGALGNLALTPLYNPIDKITEHLRNKDDIDYSSLLEEILRQRDILAGIC